MDLSLAFLYCQLACISVLYQYHTVVMTVALQYSLKSGNLIPPALFFFLKITLATCSLWASLRAQLVRNPPAMQETWVWSLGQEDPLEKEMATHSSTLAWKSPWTEKPGKLQSMGLQRVRHDWKISLHMDTLSLTKEAKIYNGLKTISLTSGAGKSGQPLVKEWN